LNGTDKTQKLTSNEQSIYIIKDQTTSSSESDFTDPQLTPVGCHAEINQCYRSEESVAVDCVLGSNRSVCASRQTLTSLTINKTQLFSYPGDNSAQDKLLKNLKVDCVTNISLGGCVDDGQLVVDQNNSDQCLPSEILDLTNDSELIDDEMPQNFRSRIPMLSSTAVDTSITSDHKPTSAGDRSIFNVSRVKKVELGEITSKVQRSPRRTTSHRSVCK
jgi:hypothetical protein